ncbi:hypothetical protein Hypma_009298 [Hypsizygus marmoreus]|uniref:Uncharacterized protein n=1 Tax=Hypsizygus marmoreus TaxID=39966 RepID=A0A369JW77_HYPMA|nr:hypothetical protein Hypma_009298 [Hypsizygus marmoreus]
MMKAQHITLHRTHSIVDTSGDVTLQYVGTQRRRTGELDNDEVEGQRQGRIEFLEKMKRTLTGWLTPTSDEHVSYSQPLLPALRYANFNRLQLELANEQLGAMLDDEYEDLSDAGYCECYSASHANMRPSLIQSPRRHLRGPRATRYGYQQQSPLWTIPEEE